MFRIVNKYKLFRQKFRTLNEFPQTEYRLNDLNLAPLHDEIIMEFHPDGSNELIQVSLTASTEDKWRGVREKVKKMIDQIFKELAKNIKNEPETSFTKDKLHELPVKLDWLNTYFFVYLPAEIIEKNNPQAIRHALLRMIEDSRSIWEGLWRKKLKKKNSLWINNLLFRRIRERIFFTSPFLRLRFIKLSTDNDFAQLLHEPLSSSTNLDEQDIDLSAHIRIAAASYGNDFFQAFIEKELRPKKFRNQDVSGSVTAWILRKKTTPQMSEKDGRVSVLIPFKIWGSWLDKRNKEKRKEYCLELFFEISTPIAELAKELRKSRLMKKSFIKLKDGLDEFTKRTPLHVEGFWAPYPKIENLLELQIWVEDNIINTPDPTRGMQKFINGLAHEREFLKKVNTKEAQKCLKEIFYKARISFLMNQSISTSLAKTWIKILKLFDVLGNVRDILFTLINNHVAISINNCIDKVSCRVAESWLSLIKELIEGLKIVNKNFLLAPCLRAFAPLKCEESLAANALVEECLSFLCFIIDDNLSYNGRNKVIFETLKTLKLKGNRSIYSLPQFREAAFTCFDNIPQRDKKISDCLNTVFDTLLKDYPRESGGNLFENFVEVRNSLTSLGVVMDRGKDREIVKKMAAELGYPNNFIQNSEQNTYEILCACRDLFANSKVTSLSKIADQARIFFETCREFSIDTKTGAYLQAAFGIFIENNYQKLIEQFVVNEIKKMFDQENIEYIIPDKTTGKSLIDAALDNFSPCFILNKENRKTLVEHVRNLNPDIGNVFPYLFQLARLWSSGPHQLIYLFEKEIKKYPRLFVPLIYDMLYYWSSPQKCAIHVQTNCLDSCLKGLRQTLVNIENSQLECYDLIITCYDFLSELEKIISSPHYISFSQCFSQQIILHLNLITSEKIPLVLKEWILKIAIGLFSQYAEELDVLNQITSKVEIDNDQNWMNILYNVCTGNHSQKKVIQYLYKLLSEKLNNSFDSQIEINSLIELCQQDSFFNQQEIDTLIDQFLKQEPVLDRIEMIALLFSKGDFLQYKLYSKFRAYQPPRRPEILSLYKKICLLLLKKCAYGDQNKREKVKKHILELFNYDVLKDPTCTETRASNNLRVVHQFQEDGYWKL